MKTRAATASVPTVTYRDLPLPELVHRLHADTPRPSASKLNGNWCKATIACC